jgi:hypothetical protein
LFARSCGGRTMQALDRLVGTGHMLGSHRGTRWNRWLRIELAETSLAHHAEHGIVEKTVGCDESRVSQEMTASREIKR